MEQLQKTFKLNGFEYIQEKRSDKSAIYAQWLNNNFMGYEVIKIKIQKESEIVKDGVTIKLQEKEIYPGEKSWGDKGWTFKDLKSAEIKFEELNAEKSTK